MSGPGLDPEKVRADFPILSRRLADDRPLVYLDSANTSQKPRQVLDALAEHYEQHNANVGRALHQLGDESTSAYETARATVGALVGVSDPAEIVFTKNISEGLNLVANVLAWAKEPYAVGPGDEVVITEMEHHSNIVPWQLLTERTGATLRWFGLTDDGRLDLSNIDDLINERTKVVSVAWVSNMLGTINPVSEIARRAHDVGALMVVDAAQAVPQLHVDFTTLGADFVGFTGHKMVGPTGIGVLWGRRELLEELPPFLGGGSMIETVRMEGSTWAPPPAKYEAGTPPIAQAIGLAAAADYLSDLGMGNVAEHEHAITAYTLDRLAEIDGLTILGPTEAVDRGGAISFELDGVHPHDVSQVLDALGIAVRAGHHCAKPAHARFGVQASARASAYLYTTTDEIDALADGIRYVKKYFGVG
ncbi:MAG: SufS family cysteine desulfurase [Propionibacteriales bacterium]|nr:SufS family cysteine desulfurase [Propionibacteriales bacterium]